MTSTETDFLRHVRGSVLRRGDDDLPGGVTGFQTGDPHRPDVVVGALDADDVVASAPVQDVTLGRMAGFVYGAAPVEADELHSPAVRDLLARVRDDVDPCGMFAGWSGPF